MRLFCLLSHLSKSRWSSSAVKVFKLGNLLFAQVKNEDATHPYRDSRISWEGKSIVLVGKGGRSKFLTQAAEKELRRLQQIKGLEGVAGAWKDKNHPELRGGAAQWVRKLRKEE
jgi:hypothetical protein